MNKSESIIELAKALSKFQGEVKQPSKDGKNPHFRSNYVTIDGVVESITDTASKHGLSFMQFPVNEEDKVGVYTLVMHESGEWIQSEPIFTRLQKNDAQGVGSALTYLRRYSLSAVFGITSENDDDGNVAGYVKAEPEKQYQKQYQKSDNQQPVQQKQNTPALMSEAQRKMIGALVNNIATKSSMSQQMVADTAKVKIGVDVEKSTKEFTSQEASKYISTLKEMEKVYEG